MKRKENPLVRELRLGMQHGNLSFLEIKRLEKGIKAARDKKFGMLTQFKAIFCDMCTTDGDSDAFFMPIRLMVAFAVGTFVQVLSAMIWCKGTVDNSNYIAQMVEVYITPGIQAINLIGNETAVRIGEPFPVTNTVATLSFAEEHLASLSTAVFAAGMGGAIFSVTFFFIVYVVMLLDFRSTVLQLRCGEVPWPVAVVRFKHSWTFVGGSIANSLLTFLLNVVLFGLVILLLAWTFTYWVIGYIWSFAASAIVTFTVTYCVNYTMTYCLALWMGPRKNIRLRYWWMAYDTIQLFLSVTTGTFTALLRILMAFAVLLIAALRIDKSIYPQWVDEIYTLDTLAKSYRAMCLIYHYHNNPIVITFCRLIEKDASLRKAGLPGMLDPNSRKWRVAQKWRKTVFMIQNPAVAAYKANAREDDPWNENDEKEPADKYAPMTGIATDVVPQTPHTAEMARDGTVIARAKLGGSPKGRDSVKLDASAMDDAEANEANGGSFGSDTDNPGEHPAQGASAAPAPPLVSTVVELDAPPTTPLFPLGGTPSQLFARPGATPSPALLNFIHNHVDGADSQPRKGTLPPLATPLPPTVPPETVMQL